MKTSGVIALLCTLFVGGSSVVMACDISKASTTSTKLEKKHKKPSTLMKKSKKPTQAI